MRIRTNTVGGGDGGHVRGGGEAFEAHRCLKDWKGSRYREVKKRQSRKISRCIGGGRR